MIDKFLLQVIPEIGGQMAKQADHFRSVPKNIFVVVADGAYRIYTAEGHALNWFAKQAAKNLNPTLIKYIPTEENKLDNQEVK